MDEGRNRIIIVDDNMTTLKMCELMLKTHYAVIPLPSVSRMFEVLALTTPDLIILDIEMPGINGFEALQQLKAIAAYAHIPVAFLSSHLDYEVEKKGRDMGAVDYLRKPISKQSLLRRVGAIFSSAEEESPAKKILDEIQEIRNLLQNGGEKDVH